MNPIFAVLDLVIRLLELALVIWIIMGWLIEFRILNRTQQLVHRVNDALTRLFEPMLRPIRRYVKPLGTIDIAPIILLIAFYFVRQCIYYISF